MANHGWFTSNYYQFESDLEYNRDRPRVGSLDCKSTASRFEFYLSHTNASIAQLAERWIPNPKVERSLLSTRAILEGTVTGVTASLEN